VSNTKSFLVGLVLYKIPNFYRFTVLTYIPEQEGAKTWRKTDEKDIVWAGEAG